MCCDVNQSAAVVVRLDVHPGRQNVVLADVLEALVDAFQGLRRLGAVTHQNDSLNDVRILVEADNAKTRCEADVDIGNVFDTYRSSLLLCDDAFLDVLRLPLTRTEQANAAYVVALLPHQE